MNRYENGKIYKITDAGYNKCYIGSTCESLSKRMERHRKHYREYNAGKTRKKTTALDIFNEFALENCKIELIEGYPCSSKEEWLKREGHYIKEIERVNKMVAGRTRQEWKQDKPEKTRGQYKRDKVSARAHYHKNKDKILEKHFEKVECPFCKRVMSQYYVRIHQGSKNCAKQSEKTCSIKIVLIEKV